ncbi:MAG: methyltransferase domain-containing protein [Clostridium sp.]
MTKFKFFIKTLKLYITNNFIASKDISKSFNNQISDSQVKYYNMQSSTSIPMLDEIITKLQCNELSNINVLEIGCGLGFSSTYLYNKLSYGSYTLVDISQNMLVKAKNICNFHCNFVESDMLSYLNNCPDNSFDVIICSYAISYSSPKDIIKECSRVLKNNGYLGVIDNLKGNFPEIINFKRKFLVSNYDSINRLPFKLNLPLNEYFFEKMFVDYRFNRLNLKSNSNTLNFSNKASLHGFLLTPSILPTIHYSLNLEDSDAKSSFIDLIETSNINILTHKYIWGAFRNDK